MNNYDVLETVMLIDINIFPLKEGNKGTCLAEIYLI